MTLRSSARVRVCSVRRGITTVPRRVRNRSGSPNCWVVAGAVVQLSFLSRPVCQPVLARLWRPRHTRKMAHARELAELIAARYPDRNRACGRDAAYVGERLRTLDDRITWTSRLKLASVLHQQPPPPHHTLGAAAQPRRLTGHSDRPGRQRHSRGAVARHPGPSLWAHRHRAYFRSRTVRIILVRDDEPQ